MKIKKVIIEGFHNAVRKEYNLDDLTYFYGKNGVGKSTALQAIQLGLLGYVPGTNKTKQGVFSHSNNHTMAVKLVLDDDGREVSIQRVWTKNKTTVSENLTVSPDGYDIENIVSDIELPLFNFDEFTHMTANSLKDWFINYLPKKTFKTDWNKELKDAVNNVGVPSVDGSLIDESAEAIQEFHAEGVEEVRQANTYFKNQLSFMKKELERKTSTIQSLIHYDDYTAAYSEDEFKDLISKTESALVEASVAKQVQDQVQKLRYELEHMTTANASEAQESVNKIAYDLENLITEQKQKEAIYTELCSEAKSYQKIISSNGVCPYTSAQCDSVAALRESYIERQNELNKQIDALQDELYGIEKRRSELEGQRDIFNRQILIAKNDEIRYQELQKKIADLEAKHPGYSNWSDEGIDQIQITLNQYKEDYGKAVANRQYNELSDVIVKDKYRIENAIECLKVWVKLTDVNGLQSAGDYNPFDVLAEDINKVLKSLFANKTTECVFINDGKANSFSFGISRDGVYVPYTLLSSGEKCLFILSLYIGLLNYTNSPVKVILIDDFLDHLDRDNFETLFNVLKENTDIQYIFAGVRPVLDSSVTVIKP